MHSMDEIFGEKVTITLEKDVALVLFDLLFDTRAKSKLSIDDIQRDPSEVCALVALFGKLESTLVESFSPSYGELLELAKTRIRTRFQV
jgi:hypothetical protein